LQEFTKPCGTLCKKYEAGDKVIYCHDCGTEIIPKGSKTCQKCGYKLVRSDSRDSRTSLQEESAPSQKNDALFLEKLEQLKLRSDKDLYEYDKSLKELYEGYEREKIDKVNKVLDTVEFAIDMTSPRSIAKRIIRFFRDKNK
jgi:DNA-directed RNA polymerase subunit M/transcription elongation factor TFIIS